MVEVSTLLGVTKRLPWLVPLIEKIPFVKTEVNRFAINKVVGATAARPQAYSLWTARPIGDPPPAAQELPANYITWPGLVDRRFTGRHLPPADEAYVRRLPPIDDVVALYSRKSFIPSTTTSSLLCFFAQWFTVGFLRKHPQDPRLNTSNHEIDLCQIYGLDAETAAMLRTHKGGKLRTSSDGRYPELLYGSDGQVKPEFQNLPYTKPHPGGTPLNDPVLGTLNVPPAEREKRRSRLYATGLDRGNSKILYTAISTIFVREHNRLCDVLALNHADWDDDRLFETARNINIVMILNLTINEYINQLAQAPIKLQLDRNFAEKQHWYRANRIAIEFDLLYRWHSFVPDSFSLNGQLLDHTQFRFNNALLEQYGPAQVIAAASRQPAGRIGPRNNPDFLRGAERAAHAFARSQFVRPFVEYQESFGHTRVRDFKELTGEDELAQQLSNLYPGGVKDVELLVGLFMQQHDDAAVLPPLMQTIVAVDAFSQILTNPLLSENVYGAAAFGDEGIKILEKTTSFDELVRRNLMGDPAPPNPVSFAYTPAR